MVAAPCHLVEVQRVPPVDQLQRDEAPVTGLEQIVQLTAADFADFELFQLLLVVFHHSRGDSGVGGVHEQVHQVRATVGQQVCSIFVCFPVVKITQLRLVVSVDLILKVVQNLETKYCPALSTNCLTLLYMLV